MHRTCLYIFTDTVEKHVYNDKCVAASPLEYVQLWYHLVIASAMSESVVRCRSIPLIVSELHIRNLSRRTSAGRVSIG